MAPMLQVPSSIILLPMSRGTSPLCPPTIHTLFIFLVVILLIGMMFVISAPVRRSRRSRDVAWDEARWLERWTVGISRSHISQRWNCSISHYGSVRVWFGRNFWSLDLVQQDDMGKTTQNIAYIWRYIYICVFDVWLYVVWVQWTSFGFLEVFGELA